MNEVAGPVDVGKAAEQAASALDLGHPEPAGEGFEFAVYRAHSRAHGDVALRVPRLLWYTYTGRLPYSARQALEQEQALCAHLHLLGLPVAEPLFLVDTAEAPVLASRFLHSEQVGADPHLIGVLLARLHRAAVPSGPALLDHEGMAIDAAIVHRVSHRWDRLRRDRSDLPPLPDRARMLSLLAPLTARPSLLHLDIRSCNLASTDGRITGLFDWGCAMVGPPALELARAAENARLPENGLDFQALLDGYRAHAELPVPGPRADALLRLDGVTMLSVVFSTPGTAPGLRESITDRAASLVEALS